MARRSTARSGKKLFYKIGEVCELTDTEPYVLRYWESEFPFLAPEKNRAGQRIYSDTDIETVNAIKRLLYEEGYTTAGARRRLEKQIEEGGSPTAEPAAPPQSSDGAMPSEATQIVKGVRDGLIELRDLLGRTVPSLPAASAAKSQSSAQSSIGSKAKVRPKPKAKAGPKSKAATKSRPSSAGKAGTGTAKPKPKPKSRPKAASGQNAKKRKSTSRRKR